MKNPSMAHDKQRLAELVMIKCHGTLDELQAAELSRLLESSAEFRKEYWESIILHNQLEWQLDTNLSNEIAESHHLPSHLLHPNGSEQGWPNSTRLWTPYVWLPIGAFMLLSIVTGGIWLSWSRARVATQSVSQPLVLGSLAAIAEDSVWSSVAPLQTNPSTLRQGEIIRVDRGMVELTLANGISAELYAPLEMRLVSLDTVRLFVGELKVDIHDAAPGFTVESEIVNVTDLGTVFSVKADGKGVQVVVFDGAVVVNQIVNVKDTASARSQPFHTGQAVHVDTKGNFSRVTQVTQPGLPAGPRSRVIKSVRDDNRAKDYYRFYEVVPGGMAEDVDAFVDRAHQWNGVTPSGMPAYLIGGDYVKTFNDDKLAHDVNIELTLSQAANVYVLFDMRMAPPRWLSQSFVNTGDIIGTDEGGGKAGVLPVDPRTLGIGPGQSIDYRHAIWKRIIRAPGNVTLGPNNEDPTKLQNLLSNINMYGIIVTPMAASN